MGAGVSAGENNDDLINNLIEANYIKTSSVERVFRVVDRGAYFLQDPPGSAYRDVAWKLGNFHISAPCIYSEVLEGLKLRPGMSFLNLGSGTGYLNTMAGLILGTYGLNHGIELHENVIEYAYQRLEEFKKHSGAIDEFDFCEPKFMQGNCLCLIDGYNLYDRIYCGAACPETHLGYMKNLIKVGGILVVPVNERLVEMRRVSEMSWCTHYLLPVSFTNLVRPEKECQEMVSNFEIEPLSLQELCRSVIRGFLRKAIEMEHPEVKNIKRSTKVAKKKKPMKRDRNGRRDTPRTSEELIDFFLLTIARKKKRANLATSQDQGESSERSASSSANNDGDTDEDPSSSSDSDDSSIAETGRKNDDESEACTSAQTGKVETESRAIVHRENEREEEGEGKVYSVTVQPMIVEGISELNKPEETCEFKRKTTRDKFDSGLGDELVISELPVELGSSSSSSDEEHTSKRCKRGKEKEKRSTSSKWRKLDRIDAPKKASDSDDSTDENRSDSDSEFAEQMREKRMYISPYTVHMRNKIQQLPLPSNVKKFLNFYRDF